MDGIATPWFDEELAGCNLADKRLDRRLRQLVERMGGSIGASIPLACQDSANTKAAYRFFSNDRVGEADILAGHFQSTRGRFVAAPGPILVLQDTTEFTYQRESADAIGMTYRINSGKDKAGRFRIHTVCGLLMHSSLAGAFQRPMPHSGRCAEAWEAAKAVEDWYDAGLVRTGQRPASVARKIGPLDADGLPVWLDR